jgi:cystathionine beta-lyase/cystathionine gamma-synthase
MAFHGTHSSGAFGRRRGTCVQAMSISTFATPVLLQPLGAGADMVVHNTSKYINGHGDVLGGVVASSGEAMERVYQHRRF